jgi:hypothetical protein
MRRNAKKKRKMMRAARGALFEKTAPLDPPQKLFIKKARAFINLI